jgi:hypothetical protein
MPLRFRLNRRRDSFRDGYLPAYLRKGRPKPRTRDTDDDGGVPVEPNRPSTLTGGAAAELEFDD